MKPFILPLVVLLMLSPCVASCSTDEPVLPPQTEQPPTPETPSEPDNDNNNVPMSDKLKVVIGNSSFTITLESNAAATAFKALLPLSLNMSDMNDNEKYCYLSTHLPTITSRPGTVHAGDLMLFGSNCLVLFYETFSSSYNYTRIGRVDNPSGFANALGAGSATVTFRIANN